MAQWISWESVRYVAPFLQWEEENGKTALIAALVLVHLVGPEAVMNGEIFSAANTRDRRRSYLSMRRR